MASIPVIDLGDGADDGESAGTLLPEACCGLGCFRVSGGRVPTALRLEMKETLRDLFDLPEATKRRNKDVISGSGYVGFTPQNPFYEAFGLYDASVTADVDAFCDRFDAPPHVRETIKTYATKTHELIVEVAGKVAEALGLEGYAFADWPCQIRMNRYNFAEDTVGSLGVQLHTDSGFLTLLQEDECIGGLEVMDASGSFIAVDPVPDTFLVNLGDVAKAWSNGMLHNVKHQVRCVAATPRISIAVFLLAPRDDEVHTPDAFVDAEHPRLFKNFKYDEYRKLRFSNNMHAGEALLLLA